MLILNAVCSVATGAEASARFADNAFVELDEQQNAEQHSLERHTAEQQVKVLAMDAYPDPFLSSSPSLGFSNLDSIPEVSEAFSSEVLSSEVFSLEASSSATSRLEIPVGEDHELPLVLVEEAPISQTTDDRGISADLIAQFDESDNTAAPPKFGQKGKPRWYVQGGVGADFDDDLFGLVGTGVSYFVFEGHSINLELNGLAVDQQNNNAVGLNLALLVRSHWIRGDNWSIYIDGGAGLLTTNNDVPDAGSSFNFTPQIGGGATFAVNDTQRIMTGLRWYHISNANTFEANPGLDAIYGYVGYSFPF
ncbi:MAG: acyloxyacyl hydrolase [Cyanobacteria bacterium P01_D01_bin.1]